MGVTLPHGGGGLARARLALLPRSRALPALVAWCCVARAANAARGGGTDTEKAVPLDDPQIEFGACLL